MDKVKLENIEKYFQLNHMFLSIMKDKNFDDKSLKMMKDNLLMMKSALKDLGVTFDDKSEEIKDLKNKIRELEKQTQGSEINYVKISMFVEGLKNKINKALEELGLSVGVQVGFNPNLYVNVNLYFVRQGALMPYDKNEEERALREKNEKIVYENFKNNFIFDKFDSDKEDCDLVVSFEKENVSKIVNAISNVLNLYPDFSTQQIKNRIKRKNGELVGAMPYLSSVELTFLTLSTDKLFSEAMAKYYS